MYVCICSAFTEKHVHQALANGAGSTAAVFRHLGHQVQCGKCVSMVRDMVADHCAGDCPDCPKQRHHADEPIVHAAPANQDAPQDDEIYAVAAE